MEQINRNLIHPLYEIHIGLALNQRLVLGYIYITIKPYSVDGVNSCFQLFYLYFEQQGNLNEKMTLTLKALN